MIAQGGLENAMKTVEHFMRKYHRKGDALGIRIKKLQISVEVKKKQSDYIIKNNFKNNSVKKNVKKILKKILLND